jgi:hypothetical protein
MKYLHTLAIPLLVVASTPALANGKPTPQEPPERTVQELEQNARPVSGAAIREAVRAAQIEQRKQAMIDMLNASASSGSGRMPQDPSVKPPPVVGDTLGHQIAKIADLIARRQAGDKPGREESEALRELVKQRAHEGGTRPGALQLNWLDLPLNGMSEEEARAAGYPCIGPAEAPMIADTPGQMTARGSLLDAQTGSAMRVALVSRSMAAFAARKHKPRRARHGVGDNPTDTKAKDYDCVDCPDRQLA